MKITAIIRIVITVILILMSSLWLYQQAYSQQQPLKPPLAQEAQEMAETINVLQQKLNNLDDILINEIPLESLAPVAQVNVYKSERYLDLLNQQGEVVRRYAIRLGFTPLGHKVQEGDGKTPEGQYVLDWRNPNSIAYKSLHVSYPNAQDRKNAAALGVSAGGNIMVHGLYNTWQLNNTQRDHYLSTRDWTEGCIAVSNLAMDEIWLLVQDGTQIEIFP